VGSSRASASVRQDRLCRRVAGVRTPDEDLKKFDLHTLIIHGDDDQIVPIGASAMISSKLVKGGNLEVCPGLSHGLFATHVRSTIVR
jgi:pimeloyl-ACP methyl ester carboxylesterase